MKILFTADLHIKLGQKNVPKDWQKARYKLLFEKLYELGEQVDLFILGGDIFDRIPTLEELHIYFLLIAKFKKNPYLPILIYPGNHEMTTKTKSFLSLLEETSYNINSRVEIITKSCERYGLDIIPYNEIKTFKPENFHSDILCTHVRGNIPPHVKAEIDLSKLDRWKVVLAGDLHAHNNSQRNIIYPGSPLSTSFHRNPINNGIILFDTKTFQYDWINLELPQLLRLTVNSENEIVETFYNHTIYELVGDIKSLAKINNNELIDKKIINKNHDPKINLKNMSLFEETELYLTKILKLSKTDINKIMEVLYANIEEDDME